MIREYVPMVLRYTMSLHSRHSSHQQSQLYLLLTGWLHQSPLLDFQTEIAKGRVHRRCEYVQRCLQWQNLSRNPLRGLSVHHSTPRRVLPVLIRVLRP